MEEVTQFFGAALIFEQDYLERSFPMETTKIEGMALIYELNDAEKIVQETTQINGMSITFKDFPLYAFQWTETRFL
ncbi:hypothetical protein [Pedobacter jeongneungensis]|uniref:hypothetical protein n=1 Tax=Pedobacter jeongneungensis TaxID=947309 RepID=UPI00046849F3|nr:hypothetical protein [Pedobacter jeongneungensis]